MPTPYEPVIKSEEAEATRDLIIWLLDKCPKGLNAREIGLQLDMSGYTISHIIRPLTASGKVKKDSAGKNKGIYSLNKKVKPAITSPATMLKEVVKRIDNEDKSESKKGVSKEPERWLIAWMVNGKGYGEVVTSKEAARARVREIAREMPEQALFYGRATARVGQSITETEI